MIRTKISSEYSKILKSCICSTKGDVSGEALRRLGMEIPKGKVRGIV